MLSLLLRKIRKQQGLGNSIRTADKRMEAIQLSPLDT